jgi:hypothetical protein
MTFVPAAEAGTQLGVTRRRVSDLWRAGELRGRKHSSGLLIDLDSVHEREALGSVSGRPWQEDVVWGVIGALSGKSAHSPSTVERRIVSNDALTLGRRIANSVTTTRFEARDPERVSRALALTGESAIDRIDGVSHERLLGKVDVIRGYARQPLSQLKEEYDVIESFSGSIIVHAFRSGTVRVQHVTPRALVAADCLRSTRTRVRRVGLDALSSMRETCLTNIM